MEKTKKEEIKEIFEELEPKNKDTLNLLAQAMKVAQEYKK